MLDTEHISALMNIVEKATAHSGKLAHIASAAMTELMEINEEIRQKVMDVRAAQEKKLQAVAAQAEANKPKAIPSNQVEPQASLFPADSGVQVNLTPTQGDVKGDVERKV